MSRIIEIWPFRGGWQYFEAEGVAPYWIGEQAKQGTFNSSKPSLPRFGDSRRGENPMTQRPHDGCQLDRDIVIMVSHYK
jgi:hypothetical protein